MLRSLISRVGMLAVVALTVACGNTPVPTFPTVPTPTTVTVSFTSSLTVNGAVTYPFVASAQGLVTVTLKSVGPNAALAIGMSLGTWNATIGACSVGTGLANDSATQGAVLTASVSTAANLCVRVYDPGRPADAGSFPADVTVEIVHPGPPA